MGNGKFVLEVFDVQPRGSAMKEVKFSSKKLWTTFFPPSSSCRQGFQSRSEPLTHKKPSSDCEAPPKEDAFQMLEGFNPLKSKPSMPNEVSNLFTISQGEAEFSPLGEFQIESLSPNKMTKVREVLSALNIKVYSKRKNRFSTGI